MRIGLRSSKRIALLAVLSGFGAWCCMRQADATPPDASMAAPAPAPGPAVTADAPTAEGAAPVAPAANAPAQPPSTEARITFVTIPGTNATVKWGKKLLGRITPKQALVVVRPRDSGPLDVVVSAPGYLPVTTRAHTFADSKVTVKLTTPENKNTLLGYRAPLDAGVPLGEDGLPLPFPTDAAVLPIPTQPAL
jgi:hypothetical protein